MLGMEAWTSYMVLQHAATEPQHATPALHTHFSLIYMFGVCAHVCLGVRGGQRRVLDVLFALPTDCLVSHQIWSYEGSEKASAVLLFLSPAMLGLQTSVAPQECWCLELRSSFFFSKYFFLLNHIFCFLFVLFWPTGFQCVVLVVLELALEIMGGIMLDVTSSRCSQRFQLMTEHIIESLTPFTVLHSC